MLTLRCNPLQVDVNAYLAYFGPGMQDSTCEFYFQGAFMHANQAYLNCNGLLACVSFFYHVIASFNFIVCRSKLFLASSSSLQSGNICKSIFCPVFSRSLCLFSTCIFVYLSSRTSLYHSIFNRLLESYSTECEFKFLDVASIRSISYIQSTLR